MQPSLVEVPLALPLGTFLCNWLLWSVLTASTVDRFVRVVQALSPARRSSWLLVFALYPLAVSAAITLVVCTPSLSAVVIDVHCHAGACGGHVPELREPLVTAEYITFGASLLLCVVAGVIGAAAWRGAHLTRMLALLARPHGQRPYDVLESPAVLACCVGILRPSIVLSRGLVESVTPAQLNVVLLHEQAHRVRLDNLRLLAAALATWPWPAILRVRLLTELRLAAELSCDEGVARAVGAPNLVIYTILTVESCRDDAAPGAMAQAQCEDRSLRERIATLAAGRDYGAPVPPSLAMLAPMVVVQIVLVANAMHHMTEALVKLM